MYYFLPVFLCFLIAQYSLLGIINSYNNNFKIKKYNVLVLQKKQKREFADKLDFELLQNQKDNNISFQKNIKSNDEIIIKINNIIKNEYKQNILYSTAFYNILDFYDCFSMPFENSRNNLINIIKYQFYNGAMPDYIKGNLYINGSKTGHILLPLIVSMYINYTGDINVLNDSVCYNSYCDKPLCDIISTEFCESIYDHTIKALNSISITKSGLVDFVYYQSVYEKMNIEKDFANILATILYCKSAESFSEYIKDYKTKLFYIEKIKKLLKNCSNECEKYLYSNNYNNTKSIIGGILYVLSNGANRKDVTEHIKKLDIIINSKNDINIIYKLLFAEYLIDNNDIEKFNIIMLNILNNNNFNAIESIFLKKILYYNVLGIKFKCGLIKIKPKTVYDFNFLFTYNQNKVNISYKKDNKKGLIIDGLLFNNLDYICLKSYNKDIYITI